MIIIPKPTKPRPMSVADEDLAPVVMVMARGRLPSRAKLAPVHTMTAGVFTEGRLQLLHGQEGILEGLGSLLQPAAVLL